MTYDFLRQALGELAAEAPIELRRSEQVWARHRRARLRTVSLTVGVAVAVVALLVLPSRADRHGLVSVPTPTTSSIASSSPYTPPPGSVGTPTGQPVSSATPTEPPASGTAGPVEAPGPQPVPNEPAAGVVAFGESHANPGSPAKIYVYPFAYDNGVDSYVVDWGDGSTPTTRNVGLCQKAHGRLAFGTLRWTSWHEFERTGDYRVTVTVSFAGCGRPRQVRSTTIGVRVDDEVAGVNGPASATLSRQPEEAHDPAPRKVALSVSASDPDSAVAFVFVEWGDGTATILRGAPPGSCPETLPGLVDDEWPKHVEHTYAAAGTYDVNTTLLVTSCDGSDGKTQSNFHKFAV